MAAIEAEGLRRTYKTHTGTVRLIPPLIPTAGTARVLGLDVVKSPQEVRNVSAIYGIAGYALLRWFEVLSRRHASLERS
jgi:hypothetical protein